MDFVRGDDNVAYLQRRHEPLRALPQFDGLAFSTDRDQIAARAPLLMTDRDPQEKVAATWSSTDTDDGSIAGLLGASPGASAAVAALIDVLRTCFPSRDPSWTNELSRLVPSLDHPLHTDRRRAADSLQRTSRTLRLERLHRDPLARKEPA